MTQPRKTPPPGATWEGTAEDVADRLTMGRDTVDGNTLNAAYANALGSIDALVRHKVFAGDPAEQRLQHIAQVLAGLDVVEARLTLRGGEQS